ncbi:MAG TPA: hypothetical protein EYQ60_05700 [Myxococcales bacterium]|nr:hypothetical protein [Myxococcales bacterium]HIK85909.1 hypothetical protein [Myxococcales bacterium]
MMSCRRSPTVVACFGSIPVYPELLEGVLDRAGDADLGVSQRPVEIEEHILAGESVSVTQGY